MHSHAERGNDPYLTCGEGACSRWAAQRPQAWVTRSVRCTEVADLGLLRSPAGASSLATRSSPGIGNVPDCGAIAGRQYVQKANVMGKDKACPVILRTRQSLEILAFKHPLAGLQLVKGSLEPGESTEAAAVRELLEEAGITGKVIRDLGTWRSASTGHTWAFHQCLIPEDLPDTWTHFAEDDGGHEFQFFWHPLASEPSEEWHQVFKDALEFLKPRLAEVSLQE